jgi:hypothetical protein
LTTGERFIGSGGTFFEMGNGLHTGIISVARGGKVVVNEILDAITLRRSDWNKVIVVDNDVDIFDLGQVLHAFSVKCHPINGVIQHRSGFGLTNLGAKTIVSVGATTNVCVEATAIDGYVRDCYVVQRIGWLHLLPVSTNLRSLM